jgi:hypothetical protein
MIDWPTLPDMGVFQAWPALGMHAFHPDDLDAAQRLIPSDRVFQRTHFDGTYYLIEYGKLSIRIKPSMWLAVADEGLRIGDRVEVVSRMLQNDPCIATIVEMRYAASQGAILYTLKQSELPNPRPFVAADLISLSAHEPLRPRDTPAPLPRDLRPSPTDEAERTDERLRLDDV